MRRAPEIGVCGGYDWSLRWSVVEALKVDGEEERLQRIHRTRIALLLQKLPHRGETQAHIPTTAAIRRPAEGLSVWHLRPAASALSGRPGVMITDAGFCSCGYIHCPVLRP